MFRAILLEKDDEGLVTTRLQELPKSRLPEGDVTVAIEYTTVNYKDGLCLSPNGGGLVRTYPHVGGIDFAGTVEASQDGRYKVGDKVVLTGWRVGEVHWGGFATHARVKADWLVPLPKGLTTRQAMAVGTAGLTAMLSLMTLEAHGLTPEKGEVLVTGAKGGVGSVAVAILSNLGYQVAAVTGSTGSSPYLEELGASKIIARETLEEVIKRPMESALWAGCIDAVGGQILARVLGQVAYGGTVASVGNAAGAAFSTSVIPFLLRGITLTGIDSVACPFEKRLAAWQRIATDLPMEKLEKMIHEAALSDVPTLAQDILKGALTGRVVIDVKA